MKAWRRKGGTRRSAACAAHTGRGHRSTRSHTPQQSRDDATASQSAANGASSASGTSLAALLEQSGAAGAAGLTDEELRRAAEESRAAGDDFDADGFPKLPPGMERVTAENAEVGTLAACEYLGALVCDYA